MTKANFKYVGHVGQRCNITTIAAALMFNLAGAGKFLLICDDLPQIPHAPPRAYHRVAGVDARPYGRPGRGTRQSAVALADSAGADGERAAVDSAVGGCHSAAGAGVLLRHMPAGHAPGYVYRCEPPPAARGALRCAWPSRRWLSGPCCWVWDGWWRRSTPRPHTGVWWSVWGGRLYEARPWRRAAR